MFKGSIASICAATFFALLPVSAAFASSDSIYCDPYDVRSYTQTSSVWYASDSGTLVTYRDGILKRTYSVKKVHTYSNCAQATTYGTAWLADSSSVAN